MEALRHCTVINGGKTERHVHAILGTMKSISALRCAHVPASAILEHNVLAMHAPKYRRRNLDDPMPSLSSRIPGLDHETERLV